jgi:hypothetical protein
LWNTTTTTKNVTGTSPVLPVKEAENKKMCPTRQETAMTHVHNFGTILWKKLVEQPNDVPKF